MARVINVHERRIDVPPAEVEALVDTLALPGDRLWPAQAWWPMAFPDGKHVGSKGGHGPVKYRIETLAAGRAWFVFPRRGGFLGGHGVEVEPLAGDRSCILRHRLEMRTVGRARWLWPLVVRPLHDALVEDALDNAQSAFRQPLARRTPYTLRVRLLRRFLLHLPRRHHAPSGAAAGQAAP